jgi:HAD superfamily hydrolase (TIGR01662 family)
VTAVVEAVVFDIGETLVGETRAWGVHADRAGLPHLTFFAALGAVIERGHDHRSVFEVLGIERTGDPAPYEREDLYPDAVPCVRRLQEAGYTVALVGNQPVQAEEFLRECGLEVDLVASSEGWGVWKPDPAFFTRVAEWVGLEPSQIAYVGDRVDNDVLPARAAGMTSVFIRRGAWGYLQAHWPEAAQADVRIESLDELPAALERAA